MLFEDSAALAGLVIAAAGVGASVATGDPSFDGAASVLIGIVLGVVAILLAREAKDLLIGERADPALARAICAAFETRPEVTRVGEVITIQIAPTAVFVAVAVDFEDSVFVGAIERLIADTEAALRRDWPTIQAIYVKPQATPH